MCNPMQAGDGRAEDHEILIALDAGMLAVNVRNLDGIAAVRQRVTGDGTWTGEVRTRAERGQHAPLRVEIAGFLPAGCRRLENGTTFAARQKQGRGLGVTGQDLEPFRACDSGACFEPLRVISLRICRRTHIGSNSC